MKFVFPLLAGMAAIALLAAARPGAKPDATPVTPHNPAAQPAGN